MISSTKQDSKPRSFSMNVAVGATGLIVGFALCWFVVLGDLKDNLSSREKSLQEWERVNRLEREAIADIKTMGVEELKQWVLSVDQHAKQFAELQQQIHRRDQQLTNQPVWLLSVGGICTIVIVALLYLLIVERNADASRTMENAVSILPVLLEDLDSGQPDKIAVDSPRTKIEHPSN